MVHLGGFVAFGRSACQLRSDHSSRSNFPNARLSETKRENSYMPLDSGRAAPDTLKTLMCWKLLNVKAPCRLAQAGGPPCARTKAEWLRNGNPGPLTSPTC